MNSKSTLVGKYVLILAVLSLSAFFSSAQVVTPNLKFIQPHIVSGDNGAIKASYKFDNVVHSTVAFSSGSQTDGNDYTRAMANDRSNSSYFKTISNSINKEPGVKYSSFDAYTLNNTVANITWTTESETDNDHFEVERSFDQKDFKTIALVFGAEGNVLTTSKYSFADNAKDISSHKAVYYRLKQFDLDGKVTYSDIKLVRFGIGTGTDTKTSVQIFPNPCTEKVTVNFESKENGMAEVRMVNTKGQIIATNQSLIVRGYNKIQLTDLNAQLAEIYMVDVIVNGNLRGTQKVIKQ